MKTLFYCANFFLLLDSYALLLCSFVSISTSFEPLSFSLGTVYRVKPLLAFQLSPFIIPGVFLKQKNGLSLSCATQDLTQFKSPC